MSESINPIVKTLNLKSHKEKRSLPRIELLIDVEIYLPDHLEKTIAGFITNISLGGVCILTENLNLKADQPVDFHFPVSEADKLIYTTRMVAAGRSENKINYGFRFVKMTDENREYLKQIMSKMITDA